MWSIFAGQRYFYHLASRLRRARSYFWLPKNKRWRFLLITRVHESLAELIETALTNLINDAHQNPDGHKKLYELMGKVDMYTKVKRIVRLFV
jgi:hypothetical protein